MTSATQKPRERTVPYYACKHGVQDGCAFCNATEEKPRAGEHTKGPWRTEEHGDCRLIIAGLDDARDNPRGIIAHMDKMQSLADARRIVAAVNACEGVPIDELEELAALKCDIPGLAGVAQMAVVNSEHEDERDALLKALTLLDQAENGPWDGEEQKRHLRTAWSIARAALAKHGR